MLLNRFHFYHPANRPAPFKIYKDLKPIPLPLEKKPIGISTLDAISKNITPDGKEKILDIKTLARILYFSGGITKTIKFPPPHGDVQFRAASCTDALYHIEIYVVCRDTLGLQAGVYHFDPNEMAIRQLRKGDYRRILVNSSGNEPSIAQAPLILVYTDVFSRNSVKYQAREYRHAFWDCGTILANTLAITSAHGLPAKIVLGFEDKSVNFLLGLDGFEEASLVLVAIGYTNDLTATISDISTLDLKVMPISDYQIDNSAINEMHQASSLTQEEVVSWRKPSS